MQIEEELTKLDLTLIADMRHNTIDHMTSSHKAKFQRAVIQNASADIEMSSHQRI